MKHYWIALFLFSSFLKAMTQPETKISGQIIDSQHSPLPFATVLLKKLEDSSMVKFEVTEESGKFVFSEIPYGNYFLEIRYVGFVTKHSPIISLSPDHQEESFTSIVLKEEALDIAGVEVIGRKPLITQKVDRMVVNVDSYMNSIGSTALEVLEKSPGISLSQDGALRLKGKPEVLVLLNGKTTNLGQTELTNLLNSMSSNQISQIEIITNPSAKYDAAGNAGVINIVTKGIQSSGLNGNVTVSYGLGKYSKSNNNALINYRTGKMDLQLIYGYAVNNGFLNLDFERNFLEPEGNLNYTLMQDGNRIIKSQNHNLKIGLDYRLNERTSLGISTSGFFNPGNQDGHSLTLVQLSDKTLSSEEITNIQGTNAWKNGTFNLNFNQSNEAMGNDLQLSLDYLRYDFSGNQEINGFSYSPAKVLLSEYYKINDLPLTIAIYSGKLDFAHSFTSGIKLETGIKSSLVKTNNTSNFYNIQRGISTPDSLLSNSFDYSENINAAYINLNKQFERLTIQTGLRIENTNSQGIQSAIAQLSDSTFKRNYFKLFPSVFIDYTLNKDHQIAFSIGRRIDRPEYRQLNPFIGFLDKYTFSTGNPFLQPQFSTNLEMNYSFRNQWTTTLNYSKTSDMINEMLVQNDSLITRTYGNIGEHINYGISESASLEFFRWYSADFYANLYLNKYNGTINSIPFIAKQLTLGLNISNQFQWGNGWKAELSGNYLSRNRDEGQAIILPSGQISLGFSKNMLNEQAKLKFGVRDLFYTQNPQEIQNFQGVESIIRISRDSRVFTLAFTYQFGAEVRAKHETTIEEQERVKTY